MIGIRNILAVFFVGLFTAISSVAMAQDLVVRYAAQDYKGAPKFKVSGYTNGSNRAVWNSPVITAVGGVDTERFGGNQSRLKWKNAQLRVKPGLPIDYFRIRFLNDHCCGPNRGGEKFGDRNLFVRSIKFDGKRYWASGGTQKTCSNGRNKPGEMFCAGTLDIKVKRSAKSSAKVVASTAPELCGIPVSGVTLGRNTLRQIQSGLKAVGSYSGPIDGIMGRGSCGALQAYMAKRPTPKSFDKNDFTTLVSERSQGRTVAQGSASQFKSGRIYVNTNDGRFWDRPSNNWIGVDAHFVNASLNGKKTKSNDWLIEITGSFQPEKIEGFLFNSNDIFSKPIPTRIATSTNSPTRGPQYFFRSDNRNLSRDKAFFESLGPDDLHTAEAACVALTDRNNARFIMTKAATSNKFDRQHARFWENPDHVPTIQAIARRCVLTISQVKQAAPNARKNTSTSYCNNNRAIIRSNQSVLQDLGLYTSTIDGISGPNYRSAVTEAEKILGIRADNAVGCLNPPERQILSAIKDARRKGSICRNLMTTDEVKTTFDTLKEAELTKKYSLGHETIGGLIWMIDTVTDLEKRLSFDGYYKGTKLSVRDCRLDRDELTALMPKEPQNIEIPAESLVWSATDTKQGPVLNLTVAGRGLETTKMSKSIFGLKNQVGMDVKFTTVKGAPALDFVISEEKTKINLHLFQVALVNRNFEVQLPELYLDEQPDGWSAFFIRMFDDGTSNIKRGEFAKILDHMPTVDQSMISALCGEMTKMAAMGSSIETRLGDAQERAVFRSSPFSNPQVQRAIGDLAKECVAEIRSKGLVEATFQIDISDVICTTDAQKRQLEQLDTDMADRRDRLTGIADEIADLQVQRPLFDIAQCDAYAASAAQAQDAINTLSQQIKDAQTNADDAAADIENATQMLSRVGALAQASDLCLPENSDLRQDVNNFMVSKNPVFVGVQCPDDQDAPKNPIQIVIDEINLTIIDLLKLHISPDEIAEMTAKIADQKQVLSDLAARLAQMTRAKASPDEFAQQRQTNDGLRATIADVQAQMDTLETDIRGLRQVMNNNTSVIAQIDALNQRLVELTADKTARQAELDDAKSAVLQAQARITQRQLETEKVMSQISDTTVQMGAASSTAGSLQQQVDDLARDIAQTEKRVADLEADVSKAKNLIDNANAVIAEKSQQVSTLDRDLNEKTAQAMMLAGSVAKLGPQADASEQTVTDMQAALDRDYIPLQQFQEQETRLNELTQIVTERTKLIRELRADLEAIEGEEQLMVRMCLADAQCKAAMGERLGVEE